MQFRWPLGFLDFFKLFYSHLKMAFKGKQSQVVNSFTRLIVAMLCLIMYNDNDLRHFGAGGRAPDS